MLFEHFFRAAAWFYSDLVGFYQLFVGSKDEVWDSVVSNTILYVLEYIAQLRIIHTFTDAFSTDIADCTITIKYRQYPLEKNIELI